MIEVNVVAYSVDNRGNELVSYELTFPRIILPEVLTHRMFSRNTSSSRAIPFKKMVESIKQNPFVPIGWQKDHKGMQGNEYFTGLDVKMLQEKWLRGRDRAIETALELASGLFEMDEVFEFDENYELIVKLDTVGVTKQIVNRTLEPFMWTKMLVTTGYEGLENFFGLRCPKYSWQGKGEYRSWKSLIKNTFDGTNKDLVDSLESKPLLVRLQNNASQAEIHIQALAEKMFDAVIKAKPEILKENEWHMPYKDKLKGVCSMVEVSTAMAARVSYTTIDDEKELDYGKMIKLHNKLIELRHDSPLEHCARCMTDEEYNSFVKGRRYSNGTFDESALGWCNNFKGFIPYRYMVENGIK